MSNFFKDNNTYTNTISRFLALHGKACDVSSVNDVLIEVESELKYGKQTPVLFTIFKKLSKFVTTLKNKGITHIEKVVIDTALLKKAKAEKAVFTTSPNTCLSGIEFYTQAEAKALGILDAPLCGLGKPKNPYDIVNRAILSQLNKGVVPWEMPWTFDQGRLLLAQNWVSGRVYRGVNLYGLLCEMDVREQTAPYFLTRKQVADKGGKINSGAKPYYVTYYGKFNVTEIQLDKDTGDSETLEKAIKFLKLYAVYNIEDTNIDYEKPDNKKPKEVERIASAEAVLKGMPKPPKIVMGGNQASYSPQTDVVRMPKPENFKQIDRYYSTFFHELVHSTKNDKRCGTDHFRKNSKTFADKQYSWEEVVAELGASYLCAEAGILHKTVGQSAQYIKGWAKSLQQYIKDDKTYFFKAANYAQKASDFILNKTADKVADTPPKKALADHKKNNLAGTSQPRFPIRVGKISNEFINVGVRSGNVYLEKGNQKFGYKHIVIKHSAEFEKANINPIDFAKWMVQNYGEIRIDERKKTYWLVFSQPKSKSDKVVYLAFKTNRKKNYYTITSEGFKRKKEVEKLKLLCSRTPFPADTLSGLGGLVCKHLSNFTASNAQRCNSPQNNSSNTIKSKSANLDNTKITKKPTKSSNALNGDGDPIVSAIKEVWPKASIVEIPARKTSNPFKPTNELKSGGTYKLDGDLGEFLGELGEIDCSGTIKGDQGAGKSQLMWMLIDAFASKGKRVAVVSPEMNGSSPTISKYRDQFVKPANQSKILFTDQKLTVAQISAFAKMFDVVFVDSFNQLQDYEQKQFKLLCVQHPDKGVWGLFQSTTGGEMRGGNAPEFDAYINIEVKKVDETFVNNYAVCTKNRFGGTGKKFNISKRKLLTEVTPEKAIVAKAKKIKQNSYVRNFST